MSHDEIVAFQAKEREFLTTPIGKAFHRFKNAHFKMAANEHREHASTAALRRDDDASKAAEAELRAEIDRLRAQNATLKANNDELEAMMRGVGQLIYDTEMFIRRTRTDANALLERLPLAKAPAP